MAVPPDGALVAAATTITVQTWEPAAGEAGYTVSGGHDHLTAVAFASSGALLGIASTDKTAIIWDVATGVPVRALTGHESSVTAVAFPVEASSGEVATSSLDSTVRIWDAATGQLRRTLAGHSRDPKIDHPQTCWQLSA